MAAPGTYLKLVKGVSGDTDYVELIVPYEEQFGFDCVQQWFQPVKEFYDGIKKIASSVLGQSGPGGAITQGLFETAAGGLRLLGTQLFNRSFLAKAWESEEPIDLPLTIKFWMGMKDLWSGYTEVYEPIIRIMKATVPQNRVNNVMIKSPGPTGLDVFTFYARSIFDGIGGAVVNELTRSLSREAETLNQIRPGSVDTNALNRTPANPDNFSSNPENAKKMWSIQIGYSTNGNTIEYPFFSLKNLIVKSSGFNFSPDTDQNAAPVSGTLKLNLSAQTLILDSDFSEAGTIFLGNRSVTSLRR